ncbi:HPr-rel-A system PqqD family peptide chaperone [Flavisphingomonas formosensis]|uniref:HPr-rel-A system PqqD family peptide chaperone n=1 Tax=Flavisphingomonas formosensis TaxID=861534 RepID=UPI0012F766EE|nr:HPr-rel-A system PqqD family peptide chaperone [Sphingomonas formosensis]
MTGPVYRADSPALRLTIELEGLTLVYHRPSGTTHVLGPPAPELLAALAEGPADIAEMVRRLQRLHDLDGGGGIEPVIAARLEELEAAGLVHRG